MTKKAKPISKHLDAIHGNALDLASDNDRAWFKRHPDRTYRFREAVHPYEFNGPIEPAPDGMRWRVIVAEIEHGVRVRCPVALVAQLSTDGFDDSQLADIFKQVSLPKVVRAATRRAKMKVAITTTNTEQKR